MLDFEYLANRKSECGATFDESISIRDLQSLPYLYIYLAASSPEPPADPATRDGATILETGNSWSRYVLATRRALMEGSSLDREAEAEGSLLPAVNTNTAHLSLDAHRQRLPIYKHRQKLLWCVEEYRVVIVVGQTGCGKSTRKLLPLPNVMINGLIYRNTAISS